NRIADLFNLFHLFLRDHDLAALGIASLRRAARGALDAGTLANVAARLIVARSRGRVQAAYGRGPLALTFPARWQGEIVRAGPLLLEPGPGVALGRDRDVVCRLRELADGAPDPKAALLERLLAGHAGKTIVFVQPRATVRYLLRRLRGLRVAAVVGDAGLFGAEAASRAEVLAAFAPLAQRAPPPVPALETDVLIATDLPSEGLNP